MNPKEKAEDLIDKFLEETYLQDHNEAVQCAFIYVEGMIEEHTFKNPMKWNLTRLRYWQQVKKEIEEL
tara:strand:+ start:448 stop:651 length:204 start_codon:yes stop_codon:yes gene_type:complete